MVSTGSSIKKGLTYGSVHQKDLDESDTES